MLSAFLNYIFCALPKILSKTKLANDIKFEKLKTCKPALQNGIIRQWKISKIWGKETNKYFEFKDIGRQICFNFVQLYW